MESFPPALETLIEQFARLPGVGRKSAQRLAFFGMGMPKPDADAFGEAIINAREVIKLCSVCQNLSDEDTCAICRRQSRDSTTICVVAEAQDVAAIERSREYKGLYHVLHGVIAPLRNIGPNELKIKELLERIKDGNITEVIMATNPDTEGETTALYIARLLRPLEIKVTRLAYGMPMGSHLEFTDDVTLARALEGRREL